MVDSNGRVVGLVFANSTTDPSEGYALTDAEVAPDISAGVNRTNAVTYPASHAPPNPDAATDTDSASDSQSELAHAAAVAEPALVKKQVGGPARLAGEARGGSPRLIATSITDRRPTERRNAWGGRLIATYLKSVPFSFPWGKGYRRVDLMSSC